MHLLNTKTLELQAFFHDVPQYAILSHTWGEEEVVFRDMQDLSTATVKPGFRKIQQACLTALEYGLGYMWIDTCCIDKTSSAELSEAINSMFRWYQESQICITYLSDVSDDVGSRPINTLVSSAFGSSRWFTRSWTLQELIAPRRLLFFSEKWRLIVERDDLWLPLYEITGVDPDVFGGRGLSKIPVARKMFWAARRKATKQEDIAYSLLGIFNVVMPMLYGEGGHNAFERLQNEIIKKTDDLTLFAWCGRDQVERPILVTRKGVRCGSQLMPLSILAKSPADFAACGQMFPPSGAKGLDALRLIEERHSEDTGGEEYANSPEVCREEIEGAMDAAFDDWESSSIMSYGSSTTLVGSSDSAPIRSGLNRAISFLLEHSALAHLFEAAIRKPQIRDERFQRNFTRMLREFGVELTIEATTKEELTSASFLRQYRVAIASAITMRTSEKCLKPIELDQPRIILQTFTEEETQRDELDFEFEDEFIPEEEVPKDAEDLEFGSMDTFILNSVAFENMVRRLNDFVNPSFRSQAQKLVEKVLKNRHTEQNEYWAVMKRRMHTVITELEESCSSCILLDVENTRNKLDRLQIWLETVTGEAWNWWPLHSPKYPMRSSEVRVGWQCRCNTKRWEVVPTDFGGSLALLLQKYPLNTGGERGAPMNYTGITTGDGTRELQARDGSSLGTKSIMMRSGSNSEPDQSAASNQGNKKTEQHEYPKPRYMFLVATTGRHTLKQLPSLYLSTDEFGQELRQVYRELKGFWRSWFSPYGFSHCDFVRFEKFCRNGFAHRGLEVPTTAQKDYYYTPRPALREPPVSPEEFSHIYQFTTKSGSASSSWTLPFYSCVESLSDDTVGCIPQRYYYLDEKSNRKEDFWGLYIQEHRSALMTSFYIVLCLSPFIIFCILYLIGIIQGDVQNATTPLALALTLLGLFLGSMIKA